MARNRRNRQRKPRNDNQTVAVIRKSLPPPPPNPPQRPKSVAKEEASLGRTILRLIGAASGGAVGLMGTGTLSGAVQGANLGRKYGNNTATLLGMGSYKVNKNSLAQGLSDGVPMMHSNSQSTIIRHTEFLTNVTSSGSANTFAVSQAYPLNPGMSSTFPWLAAIAQNYQEYTFRGLAFYYKTTSADAIASSTNTALGSVIMGTQYNPSNSAFTGKVQMLNEYYTNDCKPSCDMMHLIECDPKENPFRVQYVRSTNVPSGASVQNYDLGDFYIATAGFQGTSVVCGELYVTYEVELRKPIPYGVTGIASGYHSYGTNVTTSNYFGTSTLAYSNTWFGGTVTTTSNVITIPPGYGGIFAIIYLVYGGSASVSNVTLTTVNLTTNGLLNNRGSYQLTNTATTSTIYMLVGFYNVAQSDIQSTITFSGGTLPTSSPAMDLLLIPVPGNF